MRGDHSEVNRRQRQGLYYRYKDPHCSGRPPRRGHHRRNLPHLAVYRASEPLSFLQEQGNNVRPADVSFDRASAALGVAREDQTEGHRPSALAALQDRRLRLALQTRPTLTQRVTRSVPNVLTAGSDRKLREGFVTVIICSRNRDRRLRHYVDCSIALHPTANATKQVRKNRM